MLFNSLHFLLFFPLVTVVYFVLPHRFRWVWLLVASYYFYMSWNPRYALLIAFSTLVTYVSGLLIGRAGKKSDPKAAARQKKLWVAASFVINLSILFFFKYFDFALYNLNLVLGRLGVQMLAPAFDILLPVGISFYTFQALGYTVDVYRGDIPPERNLGKYALFVSFFPQLVAGPIERSKNLLGQFDEVHHFSAARCTDGLLLMLWGYFQKMIVADRAAILVDYVFEWAHEFAGVQIALALVVFAFQIYCDFAGYSNIAIGAAQIMGFRLMTNFRQPYFAGSVQEFWRRWHISLSTWFRDYLYIPLGGNRGGRLKKYRNTMVTFLVSGLWHGASWHFVIWGGLHGLFQVIGDATKGIKQRLYAALGIGENNPLLRAGQVIVTFLLVLFGWVFFRAAGMAEAFLVLRQLFSVFNPGALADGSLYLLGLNKPDFWVLAVSILVLLAGDFLQARLRVRDVIARQKLPVRWAVYYIAIFALLIFGVYGPGFDAAEFIYFQF